jgi:hypothetical protein
MVRARSAAPLDTIADSFTTFAAMPLDQLLAATK